MDDSHCHGGQNIEKSVFTSKVVWLTYIRVITDGKLHVYY